MTDAPDTRSSSGSDEAIALADWIEKNGAVFFNWEIGVSPDACRARATMIANALRASAQEPSVTRWLERARTTQCCDPVINGLLGQAIELIALAQTEKVPVARPVAFRVPRVMDDKVSKTKFRLFDDEDEARRAACDIGADYDGLYLVADRRAAFFAQPDPAQAAPTDEQTADDLAHIEVWQRGFVAGAKWKARDPAYTGQAPSVDDLGGFIEHYLRYSISSRDGRIAAQNLLNQFDIRSRASSAPSTQSRTVAHEDCLNCHCAPDERCKP